MHALALGGAPRVLVGRDLAPAPGAGLTLDVQAVIGELLLNRFGGIDVRSGVSRR
jgi:hypothetical protein